MTEDELQQQIVAALRLGGVTVLVTSRRRKRCWHCGRWPRGGDGVTKGLPDLLVRKDWPGFFGLEVKLPGGRLSPEQRELVRAGAAVVVRSVEDALAAAGVSSVTVGPRRLL